MFIAWVDRKGNGQISVRVSLLFVKSVIVESTLRKIVLIFRVVFVPRSDSVTRHAIRISIIPYCHRGKTRHTYRFQSIDHSYYIQTSKARISRYAYVCLFAIRRSVEHGRRTRYMITVKEHQANMHIYKQKAQTKDIFSILTTFAQSFRRVNSTADLRTRVVIWHQEQFGTMHSI